MDKVWLIYPIAIMFAIPATLVAKMIHDWCNR